MNNRVANEQKWSETSNGTIRKVTNPGGATLGYAAESNIRIISVDGYAFKDLNRDGKLDQYEDWRLPPKERARDLATKMSIEQIAGLMLYSKHQAVPNTAPLRGDNNPITYNKKPYNESGARPWDLTDQQRDFLINDNLRHVLMTSVESPEAAARWSNNLQALAEAHGMGIPINISSDPRHGTDASKGFYAGAGGSISMWPEAIGLASTFDPKIVRKFGSIAAKEYRALGITTALSPQVDLATDPRWKRFSGTFGEGPRLATDMARAYCDGFQTSYGDSEIASGWGYESVNTMVKHWPGGGTGEGGRDAHYVFGKYAVYPGKNLKTHLLPFVKGAFKLKGKTKKTAAVMPYYTISFNQDTKNGENVGNSYSSYIINDLLRFKYGYDGVICTDWLITDNEGPTIGIFAGKCWGVESLTVAQRHFKAIMAGIDQFGGNNASGPVIEAYEIGIRAYGEAFMRKRFEQSAVRLLLNMFCTGLFENPYLDVEQTIKTVGKPEFIKEGYDTQLKSIVLLKNNSGILPLALNKMVYIPKKFIAAQVDSSGRQHAELHDYPVNIEVVQKYLQVTDEPTKADCAIVFIKGPEFSVSVNGGYSGDDVKAGGNGYIPQSLQYRPYIAEFARETSIAGGDPLEYFVNRSYWGKTVKTQNAAELDMILNTRAVLADKPVIVVMRLVGPAIVNEFESQVNAIVVHFGSKDQAIMDILTGATEPSGLLPMQMPANMKTVEEQYEDLPFDIECHVDTEGNVYDYAYGLNWQGVINDDRTRKYRRG
jgi:beta-glucosidase